MTSASFGQWGGPRSELRALYTEIESIANESESILGSGAERARIASTGAIFDRETFRVMVLGEFSSGKSTLINAMLGKAVLPAKASPATAFTTVLRWGETEHATLHDGEGMHGPGRDVDIPTFQAEVELRIDASGATRDPSFARAAVYQPLEILRQGVEIVDSPGVNESLDRERLTLSFLEQVDAVVFVTHAIRPFTLTETDIYLRHVQQLGHRDIFFVVNQFDHIDEEDRDEVRRRCENAVARIVDGNGFAAPHVFFVSAREALNARLRGDSEAVERSGITTLERELESFCVRDARRVKFVRLGEFLRHNSVELRKYLQTESDLLTRSADELRESLEQSRRTQEDLGRNITSIRHVVDQWITATQGAIQREFEAFHAGLADEVSHWEVTPSRLSDRASRAGRERFRIETANALTRTLQRRMQLFCRDIVETLIFEREAALIQDLEPLIRANEEAFAELRETLTGARAESSSDYLLPTLALAVSGDGKSAQAHSLDLPRNRRPAAVGAASSAVGIGAFGGLAAAGVTLPPLGIALAIGAAIGPIIAGITMLVSDNKLLAAVGEQFAEQLRVSAGDAATGYARSRAGDLRDFWKSVVDVLDGRIRELLSGVHRNIEESDRSEREKNRTRNELRELERALTSIEERVGGFIQPYTSDPALDIPD